ncbi:MAG: 2TM domain-containing protein [Defluviitaleaceae bacterium]|nr:2TM domain-containing protein [Defluviitaleaceae bacterium]
MTDKELYKKAKKRVEAKRGVMIHVGIYVAVCIFLVLLHLATDRGGYFWPIWPIMGWGLGVAIHAVSVFFSMFNFDSAVEKEYHKIKQESGEVHSFDIPHEN